MLKFACFPTHVCRYNCPIQGFRAINNRANFVMENTLDHSDVDDDGRGHSTSIPQSHSTNRNHHPTQPIKARSVFARQKITVDGCGCCCNTCRVERRKLQPKFIEHNNSRKLTAPTAVSALVGCRSPDTYLRICGEKMTNHEAPHCSINFHRLLNQAERAERLSRCGTVGRMGVFCDEKYKYTSDFS